MPRFEVHEAKLYHCGQMSRVLRAEHAREVADLGFDVHRELVARFRESWFRRAWLIDGALVGLGGVSGTLLEMGGFIWLALSSAAMKYPAHTFKEARRQIDEIMTVKAQLATLLLPGDEASRRFARLLGFIEQDDGCWLYRESKGGVRSSDSRRHRDCGECRRIDQCRECTIGGRELSGPSKSQ